MDTALKESPAFFKKSTFMLPAGIAGAGFVFFVAYAAIAHPQRAWLAYLTNFVFFTALSCGALLFSTIMHFTKAKWSHRLSGVAEAFSSFFPVSFILFILLFLGQNHVFPWIGQDLHGKSAWLNIPFLFSRDLAAFLILYALGFGYLYNMLKFRLKDAPPNTRLKRFLLKYFERTPHDPEIIKKRMTLFAGWYMLAFALTLSLMGFDLVMSMDAHWYSTLFGAYSFIKATLIGFGALILLAAILHLNPNIPFELSAAQFRDISTLFFGFSIVWGDFFYSQFVVIWYANIPEETSYIIERTMTSPWKGLAWTVFIVCFIMPFLILLIGRIKESPRCMAVVTFCSLAGLWIEHFLLLGPNYLHHESIFSLIGINEIIISLSFLSLLAISLLLYFKAFPELLSLETGEEGPWK